MSIKKEIHEGCWEFLYIELIERFPQTPQDETSTYTDQVNNLKLEKLGFQVGQRLAERFD